MKKRLLLLPLLLFPALFASAQETWTFSQCLDTALRRNISINQARLTNQINKVNLEQDKAARYPNLSANVNEGLNLGKNIDLTSNKFVTQAFNSTSANVNTGLNLFNGLQIRNSIRQSEIDLEAGKKDIEKVINDITINVTAAYLQVLFSYEIVDAAKNQADVTSQQEDRTAKLVNAGRLAETNLLQIRAQLASDKLAVVNAENQLQIAKLNLMQFMDLPLADSFNIVKPLLQEPSMLQLQTNEEVYKKSLEVQPQIAGAGLRTSSAETAIKISEGARWPKLNLSASLSSSYASSRVKESEVNPQGYHFFNQMWDNLGQSVGLNLSIPIYSNRQIQSNIERARINAVSTRLDEQNVKNQLRKTVEQNYTDLVSAYKKYEAAKEQIANSQASYRNLETKYNLGMSTAVDFLIEKNNFFQAQSNLIQARYDYFFKMKMLDFYQGKPITF